MLFVYQLKVGLCLIAFYLVWKLLLSRETWHRFNRVLLLSVTLLAFVLPWVKLSLSQPLPMTGGMIDIEGLFAEVADDGVGQQEASLPLARYAYIIYIIGVGALLLWQLWSLASLWRLLRRGTTERLDGGITLHVQTADVSPFSYFRHIVISEQDLESSRQEILTHELAHIRLGHSWDVLLMDVVLLCQWWNPAAWLLRSELKQVHEYEADEAVLERGVDARQYQLLLIRKSVGDQLFSMANNLNYHSLKKRIRMMTTKRSSRWQQLRALTVVPVAALAVVAFASPEVENVAAEVEQAVNEPAVSEPADSVTQTQVKPWKAKTLPYERESSDTTKVYDMVEQMPEFPGGTQAMMKYLYGVMKYPKEAMEAQQEGRVIVSFVIDDEGWVQEPKVMKSVSPSLDEEALRVVSGMPKWTPGTHKGKVVRVKYAIPITFKLTGDDDKKETAEKQVFANPLIIIDGKEATKEDMQALDTEAIESVDILKDESGVKLYGDKGKNGVIILKLKKQK